VGSHEWLLERILACAIGRTLPILLKNSLLFLAWYRTKNGFLGFERFVAGLPEIISR